MPDTSLACRALALFDAFFPIAPDLRALAVLLALRSQPGMAVPVLADATALTESTLAPVLVALGAHLTVQDGCCTLSACGSAWAEACGLAGSPGPEWVVCAPAAGGWAQHLALMLFLAAYPGHNEVDLAEATGWSHLAVDAFLQARQAELMLDGLGFAVSAAGEAFVTRCLPGKR